jgi:hypothetical protein
MASAVRSFRARVYRSASAKSTLPRDANTAHAMQHRGTERVSETALCKRYRGDRPLKILDLRIGNDAISPSSDPGLSFLNRKPGIAGLVFGSPSKVR